MANDNSEEFVNKRLQSLKEPEGFAPKAAQAKIMLRTRPDVSAGRWIWRATVAAVLLLFFGALPAARAIAQTGTLSPNSFFHSVHETMYEVHMFFWRVLQHVPWPGN